ncbi:hypothetical protein OKJ48_20235 [Streptomyces kunmingensis]|uniref:Helix-turn-helix domain-containing protein n=1 Tax=Streptomyces kunmingensis TaxID=68225 RepID=A0ABU6CCW5_9ACTN|nr:hypothetical protein [Streptomyces kunmingensis]MEB3962564.1 hypothetical protein [Streptomyces kunmingensis]
MQIHRMPRHERDFTVIDNKALRDPRLSHTARGILVYVLSLPSGAPVNVRTLSDGFLQGRIAVAKAVKELREFGYWVTQTEREQDTRRIVSSVDVYEVPGAAPSPRTPVVSEPVPGRVGTGESGTFFPGGKMNSFKDGEKNPPCPPAPAAPPASAPAGAATAEAATDLRPPTHDPHADNPHVAEGARILRRLADVDSRLRLSERGVRELVPEVAVWLERGASAAEVVDAVTAGLPGKVYSAARLISDRLTRKRPERRRAWRRVYECPKCRDPLPWGQETGVCRSRECSPETRTQANPPVVWQPHPQLHPEAALQPA